MADTATLNVRMETETKNAFVDFCNEVGLSASSLMNMFAKTVVRNQRVPFPLTSRPLAAAAEERSRIFPSSEAELDAMLSEAESVPAERCVPADEAFAAFEGRMGW